MKTGIPAGPDYLRSTGALAEFITMIKEPEEGFIVARKEFSTHTTKGGGFQFQNRFTLKDGKNMVVAHHDDIGDKAGLSIHMGRGLVGR